MQSYIRHGLSFFLMIFLVQVLGSVPAIAGGRAGFYGGVNFADQGGDMNKIGDELAADLDQEIGGSWSASKSTSRGLAGGAYYMVEVTPAFGVQIEAQYIRRGTMFDMAGRQDPSGPVAAELEMNFQVDYFEVPVLARFTPSPAASVKPIFFVGPVIGFKVGAKLALSANGQDVSTDISEVYTSTTVGALAGLGLAIDVGERTSLLIQGRYYLGLSNPLDSSEVEAKSSDYGFFAGLDFAVGQ